jgi:hypothetical protein
MPKYTKKKVSPHFSVWTTKESDGPASQRCLILAHGGMAQINGMWLAPKCRLKFYVPHGTNLPFPGVFELISGRAKAESTVESRKSQDYYLTKSATQNIDKVDRSLGGIELEQIADKPEQLEREIEKLKREIEDGGFGPSTIKVKQIKIEYFSRIEWIDIVVIQSNSQIKRLIGTGSLKLSDVLRSLWAAGYSYEEVLCGHCRGGMDKPSGKVSYNA